VWAGFGSLCVNDEVLIELELRNDLGSADVNIASPFLRAPNGVINDLPPVYTAWLSSMPQVMTKHVRNSLGYGKKYSCCWLSVNLFWASANSFR